MGILKRMFGEGRGEPSIEDHLDNIIKETMRIEERWRSRVEAIRQREERAKARRIARIGCYAKSRKYAKRGRVRAKHNPPKRPVLTAWQIFKALISK